ncbi:MAG: glycosyltransferase [Bacteroidales bacterium]|nr:glycosyltransferase [Bacteroidales bacterium]
MISIVIPLYNKENFIASTLRSVLAQSYGDFEVVIVDDGSTDNSLAIIDNFNDSRIRIISQANKGVSAARNRGIAEAKGEYIALLDADDEWKPDFLQTMIYLTEKYPECDVFTTDYEFRDTSGHVSHTIIRNIEFEGEDGRLDNYFEVAASSHPPICSISIMARKSAFTEIGGFPIGVKSGEDLLTWARLAAKYKIAYSRKALAVFNIEGYNYKEKPKRIPAEIDIVGQQLLKIKKEVNPHGINAYISHWHKMRSSVYMRLGMRKRSIGEAMTGLKYNPLNYKLLVFIALNLLPKKFQPF